MIILDLPLPNSANTHWRHARGFTYISKKGVEFRTKVADYVSDHRLIAPDGRLAVAIDLYPDSKRRMDIDNRVKPLLDALQHAGVIEDDSLIDKLYVERKQILKGGKCRVYISKVTYDSQDNDSQNLE
jgi:crossover junction endodeoxyribonuclease RusA